VSTSLGIGLVAGLIALLVGIGIGITVRRRQEQRATAARQGEADGILETARGKAREIELGARD
jgi:ABC-type Fe3+ transport system permease subunit